MTGQHEGDTRQRRLIIIHPHVLVEDNPRGIRWRNLIVHLAKKYKITVLCEHHERGVDANTFGDSVDVHRLAPLFPRKGVGSGNHHVPRSKLYYRLVHAAKQMYHTAMFPDKYWRWPWRVVQWYRQQSTGPNDLVICPVPIHANIIAGWLLSIKFGARIVFDYGDPWTHDPTRIVFSWRRRIDHYFERRALNAAVGIVLNSRHLRDHYIETFKLDEIKVHLIYNGAPEYTEQAHSGPAHSRNEMLMVYAGKFIDKVREPYDFYDALSKMSKDSTVRIQLIGDIYPRFQDAFLRTKANVPIEFPGILPQLEVISREYEADLLLFWGNRSNYQLPSKIFEYLQTGRPILVISYDVAHDVTLRELHGELGIYVVPNEVEAIYRMLKSLVKEFQTGVFKRQWVRQDYSYRGRAKEYFGVLERIFHEV